MFTSVQDHNCPSCGNKQLFRVNGLPLLRTTRRALHGSLMAVDVTTDVILLALRDKRVKHIPVADLEGACGACKANIIQR